MNETESKPPTKAIILPPKGITIEIQKNSILMWKLLTVKIFLALPVRFVEEIQLARTPTRKIPARKAFSF